MREIKFRAWDKENKKMFSPTCIDFGFESCLIGYEKDSDGNIIAPSYVNEVSFDRCTLMQFTGLKDKNGKEIYLLDYIKTPTGIGLVVWDKCYWIKWKGSGRTTLHDTSPEQMEVFGNEYEGQKTKAIN